jgi:hypothetical protein
VKKKTYGSNDIISVYKLMEKCGLHCEVRGNIAVTHGIMMRKLCDRNKKFPEKITIPKEVPFYKINKEAVKRGNIILVMDDNKQVKAYSIPLLFREIKPMTEYEREIIRQKLIQEELEKSSDIIKDGYKKYLYRKAMKEQPEEIQPEIIEEYDVTEKVYRLKKLQNKKRRY